jgi:hypothetical protein
MQTATSTSFIEYAKAGPEDICIRIEAIKPRARSRRPALAAAPLVSATPGPGPIRRALSLPFDYKPLEIRLRFVADESNATSLHNLQFPYSLGTHYLYAPQGGEPLFTDNENNAVRLYGCSDNRKPYVKDAFHRQHHQS